jgi:hypothetical protein
MAFIVSGVAWFLMGLVAVFLPRKIKSAARRIVQDGWGSGIVDSNWCPLMVRVFGLGIWLVVLLSLWAGATAD